MFKAVAIKELRETWWLAGIALVLFAFAVADLMGIDFERLRIQPVRHVPFVGDDFHDVFCIFAPCLAIALGFRQTMWESFRGTWLFLLHRPMSRNRLIGVKLLVGLALYLICTALPILVYACWASVPGTHASPFEWAMTAHAWMTWFCFTMLYLGAFLCGMREARWHGTRLLPLIAAGFAAFAVGVTPLWPGPGTGTVLVMDAALLAGICLVSRTRDFS